MIGAFLYIEMNIAHSILNSIVRPIIRFCIRHNITIQQLNEAIKDVFIQEAKDVLQKSHNIPSASRINIMTGVHRIDIARFQSGIRKEITPRMLNKVVGHWLRSYKTIKGEAKILGHVGVESDFFKMVQEVNTDLNPYTLLFELERLNMIEKTSDGLKLINDELILNKNLEMGAQLYELDSTDLLCAIEENVTNSNPLAARHHLRTEFDAVSEIGISEIRKWIHKTGANLHKSARKQIGKYDLDTKKSKKSKPTESTYRVVLTSFAYIEPHDQCSGDNEK